MKRWLLVVIAAFFTTLVRAQDTKSVLQTQGSRHEIALQLGAFRPTARFGINGVTGDKGERFGGTGFLFVVDYFHRVTSVLSAGLEGLHINRGTYELKNLAFAAQFAGASTQVRGNTTALLATLRLRAPGTGIRPYLLGGIGAHMTTMDAFMQSPPGTYWGAGFGPEMNVVQGGSTGLIGTLRGGIEHTFTDNGTLGIEIGWIGIPAQRYSRTALGRTILPNDIVSRGDGLTLSAKFGYRFGGGY